MARHFIISIRVAYDEAHPIPADIKAQLEENVVRVIGGGLILTNGMDETVIEDYQVQVEEGLA